MKPIINFAKTDDIPALVELLEILFKQEVEFQPDKTAQSKGLESIITNEEKGFVLVARDGEEIIGMVNILFTISTALGGRVALLEDMIISPKAQNNGIGTRLLQEAQHLAKAKDCPRITLLTDADNHPAHRFYKQNGFTPSSMTAFRQMLT